MTRKTETQYHDEIETALAWALGEINIADIARIEKEQHTKPLTRGGQYAAIYCKLATRLRQFIMSHWREIDWLRQLDQAKADAQKMAEAWAKQQGVK